MLRGITSYILYWKSNNWKLKSSGKDVKNKELWTEIDSLSNELNVSWVHINRDSEVGQIEAVRLAKRALNVKTPVSSSAPLRLQNVGHTCDEIECSDDDKKQFR